MHFFKQTFLSVVHCAQDSFLGLLAPTSELFPKNNKIKPGLIEFELVQGPWSHRLLDILQAPQGVDGCGPSGPGSTAHSVEGLNLFVPPHLKTLKDRHVNVTSSDLFDI